MKTCCCDNHQLTVHMISCICVHSVWCSNTDFAWSARGRRFKSQVENFPNCFGIRSTIVILFLVT